MPPVVDAALRRFAAVIVCAIATICAPPAVDAEDAVIDGIVDARGLDLALRRSFTLDAAGIARAEGHASPVALGDVLAPGGRSPVASGEHGANGRSPRLLSHLPFSFRGGQAVFEPGRWRLQVGKGATPSRMAGRADLSPTRVVTGAAVGTHGGNVHLQRDRAGPRVGALFANFNGLGHRHRARLDVDLAQTRVAASFDAGGRADAAIAHVGRWRGLDTEARAALVVDRALRVESSAALRDRPSGWSFNVAAMGARSRNAGRVPASLYTKLARTTDREGPITAAWSLEAAYGHDVAKAGDHAWLAGATLLQRFEGLGRLHLRYRYQSLDGEAGREGHAHAVTLGLRLRL